PRANYLYEFARRNLDQQHPRHSHPHHHPFRLPPRSNRHPPRPLRPRTRLHRLHPLHPPTQDHPSRLTTLCPWPNRTSEQSWTPTVSQTKAEGHDSDCGCNTIDITVHIVTIRPPNAQARALDVRADLRSLKSWLQRSPGPNAISQEAVYAAACIKC